MNVTLKEKSDVSICIAIDGRIDASNAKMCHDMMGEIIGAANDLPITIDCENLENISSAGLREFMHFAKQSKEKIRLIGVSRDVYDVFEVTGMVRLFDVLKKIEEFDVSGYDKLGEGTTGVVYKIDDELIVKMYNPSVTLEMVEREKNASKESFLRGIPTAIPFEIIKNGECYGMKYELMNSMTLGQAFNEMPEKFDELVTKYVDVIKKIKETEVEPGVFPKAKDIVLSYFSNIEQYVPKEDYDILKELVSCIPDQNRFVHGDMHPGNIMLQNDELLIIDMAEAATGWEFYDLTQVYNDIYYVVHMPRFTETAESKIGMKRELLEKVWESFITKYCETDDKEVIAKKIEEIKLASSPTIISKIISRLGNLSEAYKANVVGLLLQELFYPVIKPNVEKIKEIYAKNITV